MVKIEYKVLQDMTGIERFSYSKISSFYTCPYMYKFNYIDGVEGVDNGFAAIGSLVHSILERYYRGELEQFEMSQVLLDEFDEAVPDGVVITFPSGFSKDLTEQYKEQCVEFLDYFEGFENYRVAAIEDNFNLLLEIKDRKIILNGFIDLVIADANNNYYIIDWKSKAKFKNQQEINEYARQLYTYAIYIKHHYGEWPNELRFVQFRINHTEIVKFSEDALNETLDWIYQTIKKIENENFFFPAIFNSSDIFFCQNLCDYGQNSGICEYFADHLATSCNNLQ